MLAFERRQSTVSDPRWSAQWFGHLDHAVALTCDNHLPITEMFYPLEGLYDSIKAFPAVCVIEVLQSVLV